MLPFSMTMEVALAIPYQQVIRTAQKFISPFPWLQMRSIKSLVSAADCSAAVTVLQLQNWG